MLKISIHHRVGVLAIGEIPVVIAVACAHRNAAFEACQFTIDTLKETVPIWKKSFLRMVKYGLRRILEIETVRIEK